MDSDSLDEQGITLVLWDALAEATESSSYDYHSVLDRIRAYRKSMTSRDVYFKTEAGLDFYKERIVVYDRAIDDLEFEIGVVG